MGAFILRVLGKQYRRSAPWMVARMPGRILFTVTLESTGAGPSNNGNDSGKQYRRKRKPMSEETKRKISLANRGKRRSEEVRKKIAEGHTGLKHSDETREKISSAMEARGEKSLSHRYNIALSRVGKKHSEETKMKMSETKQRKRKQKLAARAAAAAEKATADLRHVYASIDSPDENEDLQETDVKNGGSWERKEEGTPMLLNPLQLEKAVLELVNLRESLTQWMNAYESRYGRKPNLTETSETHPFIYGKFVRYVALRDLVRRSSTALGESPATWE